MKVVLLNDTSGHLNWGCQATSAGLKQLIELNWPEAEVTALPAEKLPFAGQSFRRKWLNHRLAGAIEGQDNLPLMTKRLLAYGVDAAPFSDADILLLNGEGMIHKNSGHFFRLLGVLNLARQTVPRVAVVNQTVDVTEGSRQARLITTLFPKLDAVQTRDTKSLDLLRRLDVLAAALVPDAAFMTTPATQEEAEAARKSFGLAGDYIALTGSSALGKKDGEAFAGFCRTLRSFTSKPLVLLASTKTDLRLGKAVKDAGLDVKVLGPETSLRDVLAIIKGAEALIGGRFHPMIFAALSGTPILCHSGNTHKTEGLLELLQAEGLALSGLADPELAAKLEKASSRGPALEVRAQELAAELKSMRFFQEAVS